MDEHVAGNDVLWDVGGLLGEFGGNASEVVEPLADQFDQALGCPTRGEALPGKDSNEAVWAAEMMNS